VNAVITPKRKLRKIQIDKGKERDRVPKNTKGNDGERFCTTIAANSHKIISNIRLRIIKKEEGRINEPQRHRGRRGRGKKEEGKDVLVDL